MAVYRQVINHPLLARLSLNSFWLLAARVISQALAVLFTLAIARALGEAAFGRFAFISAIVFIGNVFSTYGLDTLIIREVALARAAGQKIGELIHAALALQLLLALLYILIVWTVGTRLTGSEAGATLALRIAILSLIPLAFSTIFSAVLRGHEKMAAYMAFSVITAAAAGLGAAILYWRGGSLVGAAWVVLLAQTGGAVAAYYLCRRAAPWLRLRHRPDRRMLVSAGRGGAMLAALMVLAVVYQRLGVILLSLLDGDTATGLYSAAAKVLEVLKMLPAAVFGALLPMMAAEQRSAMRRSYRHTVVVLIGLGVAVAALTALLARPIIAILYGAGFAAAVTPLRVMAASLPLTVLAFALSFNLVAHKQERIAAIATLLTLSVAAPTTAWLISRWSVTGAALALPLCEAAQVVILTLLTVADRRRPIA